MVQHINWQGKWDKLSPSARLTFTLALLFHLCDLYRLFDIWATKSMGGREFFMRAHIGSCQHGLLVRPLMNLTRQEVGPQLKAWRRTATDLFHHSHISDQPPSTTGPFFKAQRIPMCLRAPRPAAAPSGAPASDPASSRRADPPRDHSRRTHDSAADAQAATPAGAPAPGAGRAAKRLEPGKTIARICLIVKESVPGGNQNIMSRLRGIDEADRPKVPTISKEGHRWHKKKICFNYVTKNGPGCKNKHCRLAHVDLEEEADRAIGTEPFAELCTLIRHPAINPGYSPSADLVNFVGEDAAGGG